MFRIVVFILLRLAFQTPRQSTSAVQHSNWDYLGCCYEEIISKKGRYLIGHINELNFY